LRKWLIQTILVFVNGDPKDENKKGGTRPPGVSKSTCVIPVIFWRPGTLGQNTSGNLDYMVSPEPSF